MSAIEIKVPDIGDFKDVEVIELLVKPGDTIRAEQSLITVESDKASMEIPSTAGGVVKELKVKIGDKVNEGTVVLLLEAAEPAAATPAPAPKEPSPHPSPAGGRGGEPTAIAAAAGSASAGLGGQIEVRVPDIGDFKDVEVIELLVKAGDTVKPEQSLITVESDKASMEIPSTSGGVVKEMRVKLGDKVNQGTVVLLLEAAGVAAAAPSPQPSPAVGRGGEAAAAPLAAASAPAVTAPVARTPPVTAVPDDHIVKPHASPSVRKFARELGVDLHLLSGSGPKQRITQDDVRAYVKRAVQTATTAAPTTSGKAGSGGMGLNLLPWPSLDFSKFGPTHEVAQSRIKKLSGPNLARNWAMIPHVTQFDEADVTDLEQFRKDSNESIAKSGVKLTMLAFVIKACVAALKAYPNFNSSLDATGENLILKDYWHIGFAADTPNGLVVPVVRNADQKGIVQIAREMGELSAKAREGKLGPSDMQGASFTISSLGGIGGTAFTPIINAPEVAILGLSKSEFKPRWDGKQFVPRLMMPLSLSYDHRVIDGAQAARFTVHLAGVLADMRKVLL